MKCEQCIKYKKSILFTCISLSLLISVYVMTNDDILYDNNSTSPLLNNTIELNITESLNKV